MEIAGRDASGVVFVAAFYPQSQNPMIVDFVSRFRAAFGEAPDLFAAQGYDAAVILRTLIDRAGQISREQLRRDLLVVKGFHGVSGLTAFDESGGTRKELRLLTVHRGAIRSLDELP
ncbi:MAG: ABC transporter substrate-binding protein [Proteobacteria bacterium]|nr:ABC transporter substrate-binding protein [Pseudomonadota bacterium]